MGKIYFNEFTCEITRRGIIDVDLYFHLANHWSYLPDAGTADLAQPEVLNLFFSWCAAFERHLITQALQDIQLTIIR